MLAMILFTGLTSVFSDKSVVAYVSIDINPSIELGIDKNKRVREMQGLNDKGLEIVRSVSYKGRSMDDVTDKILQKAEEMKVFAAGEADIVITSTIVKDDAALDDTQVTEALKQQVLAHVVTKHPEEADKIQVTAFAAPVEIMETAKENGLSVGKYSVYLNAKSAGHDIKVEDLQKDSVHNIANAQGGIAKLMDPKNLEKESIRELLKEEKDGTLDKKLQEKKATPSPTKTPQKSTSPTNKATTTPGKNATPTPTSTPKSSAKPAASPSTVRNGSAPAKSPASATDKKDDNKKDNNQNGKDKQDNNSKKDDDKETGKKDDGRNDRDDRDKNEDTNKKDDDKNSNGKKEDDRNSGNKKDDDKTNWNNNNQNNSNGNGKNNSKDNEKNSPGR
jgi:hypothetical protein